MGRTFLSNLKKLPLRSYATLPEEPNQAIIIQRGVSGYWPVRTLANEEAARHWVKSMNEATGVTPKQASAMLHGSIFGWHVPAADPDNEINREPAQ